MANRSGVSCKAAQREEKGHSIVPISDHRIGKRRCPLGTCQKTSRHPCARIMLRARSKSPPQRLVEQIPQTRPISTQEWPSPNHIFWSTRTNALAETRAQIRRTLRLTLAGTNPTWNSSGQHWPTLA